MKQIFTIVGLLITACVGAQTQLPLGKSNAITVSTGYFQHKGPVSFGLLLDTTNEKLRFPTSGMDGRLAKQSGKYYIYDSAGQRGFVQINVTGGTGGTGTVTSVSGLNTTGVTWSIANPTTTPSLSLSITKAGVGLAQVDNTSDANKPVSTAQAAAIAAAQAYAIQRANHTGTQSVSTITGLAAIATSGNASDLTSGSVPAARFGAGTLGVAALNATGTPSATTYLRGDGSWATPSGGGSAIVLSRQVWVDTTGNNATAQIGNPGKPFKTIDAALDAIDTNGYVINIGLGIFASPTYTKVKPNLWFKGAGKPQFNNVAVGGSNYPLYSLPYPTAFIGGTVFVGTFRVPKLCSNIHLSDFGVDATASNTEGLLIANEDGFNSTQVGKKLRNNVLAEHLNVLRSNGSELVHGFVIENCYAPVVNDVEIYGGFAGFVTKCIGGSYTNIRSHFNSYYGIIVKQNSYSSSYNTILSNFSIDNTGGSGGGLWLYNEDGDAGLGQRNINVSNGVITNCSNGIFGFNINTYANIHDVTITGCGNGIYLTGLNKSKIHDCIVTKNSGYGIYIQSGGMCQVTGNYADSNTTQDIYLTGASSSAQCYYADNVATTATYGSNTINTSSGGSGGSGIAGLTTGKIPVASSSTTIADGSFTDGGSTNGVGLSLNVTNYTPVLTVTNTGTNADNKNIALFKGYASNTLDASFNPTMGIRQMTATDGNFGVVGFFNSNYNIGGLIGTRFNHTANSGDLVFGTTNSSTFSLKAIITSDGKLGLGTLTPATTLDVNGTFKTAQPSSFGAGVLLLGKDVLGTNGTDHYWEVSIDGNLRYIPMFTTKP